MIDGTASASTLTSYPVRAASAARRSLGRLSLPLLFLVPSSCRGVQIYSHEEDVALGIQAYEEILGEETVLTSGPEVEMVERVTDRLVASAMETGPDFLDLFEWEVRVIDNPEVVNAFCLPGGKMAVYTGILPVAEDDTGLAVVMGHEIAHAVERHGTKRLSNAQLRGVGISIAVGAAGGTEEQAQMANLVGDILIGLPYSRKDELEADERGLTIMAGAGYDPRRAVSFWERMSQLTGGGGGPQFLSTHPSNQDRIAQIRSLLPAAEAIYEQHRRP